MPIRKIVAMVLLGMIVVLGAIVLVVYAHQLPFNVDLFVGAVAVVAAWLFWLLLRLEDREH